MVQSKRSCSSKMLGWLFATACAWQVSSAHAREASDVISAPPSSASPATSSKFLDNVRSNLDKVVDKIQDVEKAMNRDIRKGAMVVTATLREGANKAEQVLYIGVKTATRQFVLHDSYIIRDGKLVNLFRAVPDYMNAVMGLYTELKSRPNGYTWERTHK